MGHVFIAEKMKRQGAVYVRAIGEKRAEMRNSGEGRDLGQEIRREKRGDIGRGILRREKTGVQGSIPTSVRRKGSTAASQRPGETTGSKRKGRKK